MTLPTDIIAAMRCHIDSGGIDRSLSPFGMTIRTELTALRQGGYVLSRMNFMFCNHLVAISTRHKLMVRLLQGGCHLAMAGTALAW